MKKNLLFILMALSGLGQAFSQSSVSQEKAFQTAKAFINSKSSFQDAQLQLVSASDLFIYNIGNQGFVIVSNNTILPPILAYSDQGNFPNLDDAPDNFRSWIAHYEEMIDFALANHLSPEADIQLQWDEAEKGVFSKGEKSVSPLISTQWNQDCYYNEYCPSTGGGWWGGPCGHAYAGCVACAMAQVMKYWNYPETGFGSHSYNHSQYGQQSANFAATTYHWTQMPVEIWSHNDAVATLMYHCGVSVDMNYSPSGSGAQSQDVETAMRSYFGYCGAKFRQKSNYQDDAWIAMLKTELDQSHPIYYSGANGDSGHAFVCDGYDSNDLMHFNFGWSGEGDAFYSTYDVNGFNQGQAVVMNLFPMNIQADVNGIIYVSPDGKGDGSSWANATDKLQFASALSSGGGTKVWVKGGTYYGDTSDPEGAFCISKSNHVYGGFEGNESPDYDLSLRDFYKNATILDGQGARRVLLQDQAFTSATLAIWDGFTIQNGYAGSGAGAYLNNYVTLTNCTVMDNEATMFGGGIYINSTGGTARVTLNNCRIMDNSASMGGGLCDRVGADYTNCRISNNTASTKGGGIYLYNNTEPTFKNCILSNNTAKNAGGMYARGKFKAYNCDIVMNLATESSGGVFHENKNKYYNCIVWGNVVNDMPDQFTGLSDFEYSAVCGSVNGSENYDIPVENDGEEPGWFVRFAHPAESAGADFHNEDWSLQPSSICLNAGKPETPGLGPSDIDGNPRIRKGRVDIGACEHCSDLSHLVDTMHENNTYWFHGRLLTKSGYYTAVIPTPECDSVIGLTLTVLEGLSETSESATKVWPNPTNGLLHIEMEEAEKIEAYNVLGQIVLQAEKVETIDLSNLEKGVYFLIISNKNGAKTVNKVIKE